MKRILNYAFLIAAIAVAVWFFVASRKEAASAPDSSAPQAKTRPAEAPLVWVQKVVEKEVAQPREYVGRVEAIDTVDLMARVSGYLETIDFTEGHPVKAGDLMFTIEKERFQAEIDNRRGTVSQIEASLVEAQKYLRRLQSAKLDSVPEKDIETAQKNVDSFAAQLVSAKANLKLAEIDLEYATVRSPLSGRVSKKSYSVGDYIGPNSGTIATVVQFDPIRVVCSMSEVEYLDLMKQTGASPQNKFQPTLRLPNGAMYSTKGKWDFADTKIDPSTGSISLWSRYSNPAGLLIPGEYVSVVLSPIKGEILPLVPQSAVGENSQGSYVYVVGADNVAEMRMIKKRSVLGTDWIVENGIRAGETVIVEGLQKVQPGQTVKPSSGPPAQSASPAGGN